MSDKSMSYDKKTQDYSSDDYSKNESKDSMSSGSEKVKNITSGVRDSIREGFGELENRAENLGETLMEKGQYVGRIIQERVNRDPWMFIGGVAIAAFLLGMVSGRRASKSS